MWHRLQILISKEQFWYIRNQAFALGISIGELLRRIIDDYRRKESEK